MKFIWRFIESLPNNYSLKGRNAADTADVEILKVNASDQVELIQNPIIPAPTLGTQAAQKSSVDSVAGDVSVLQSDVSSLQSDVSTLQSDVLSLQGNAVLKDGSVAFTGNQSMGGNKLTNLGTPTASTDAATKSYVDSAVGGSGAILADGSVPFTGNQSMGGNDLTNAGVVQATELQVGASNLPITSASGGGGGIDAQTSLLLHLDGNATDSALTPHTMTLIDTPSYVAGEFSQGADTNAGFFRTDIDASLNFGSGNFTMEMWVKAAGGGFLISNGVGGVYQYFSFNVDNDGTIWFTDTGANTRVVQTGTGGLPFDSQFHHVALVRNGSNLTIYVDGAVAGTNGSYAGTISYNAGSYLFVGGLTNNGGGTTYPFPGTLDEVRISQGVARYTAAFTPPAAPFGSGGADYFNFAAANLRSSAAPVDAQDLTNKTYVDAQDAATQAAAEAAAQSYADATFIPLSQKGAASGVATLDGGGKIPSSQLPNSVMEYKGQWAASTNTPTLSNGTGNAGDVYQASDAGTVDFGAGNITFAAGDWAVYNGTVWEKSINSNAVASVNGFTGVVVLDTDDVSEGATNLYFTDSRAVAAALASDSFIEKDGSVAFTGNQSLGGFKLTNVSDPSAAQDAATKNYVDSAVAGVATSFTGVRYVAKNGSDITGDGSLNKPYLTVKAAMDSITDATNLKRYALMVMPGRYSETGLTMKPNVFIIGQNYFTTRIQNSTALALDSTFSNAGDNRSGLVNINLASQLALDFNAIASNEGKFYVYGSQLAAGVVYTAYSDINQAFIENSDVFGGIAQTGMNVTIRNTMLWSGDLTMAPRVGGTAELQFIAGYIAANVALNGNNTDSVFARIQSATIDGTVTVDGSASELQASADSLPASQTILNGALISLLDLAENVGYAPATAGDWSALPDEVKQALDTLAADAIKKNGSKSFTADQSMGGNKLTSVATPTASGDAANKGYVDTQDAAVQAAAASDATSKANAAQAAAETYAEQVASRPQEQVVLSSGDITAKQITLANAPLNSAAVRLSVYGGPQQAIGTDYSVAGSTLSWSGLGLDGLLVAGDRLLIDYSW